MWLVLADTADLPAQWAYAGLKDRGLDPLHRICADELALSPLFEQRLSTDSVECRIRLSNGLRLGSDTLCGVLNRLHSPSLAYWRSATQADRDYAFQEMQAAYLSWLHALPCPVINRPSPRGLCGAWLHVSEWAQRAYRCGLPVAPYRQSSSEPEPQGGRRLLQSGKTVTSVVVCGSLVVGADLPDNLMAGCRQLAQMSQMELLGVDFVDAANGSWAFAGATPMPNLLLGGQALLDALAVRLRADRSEA